MKALALILVALAVTACTADVAGYEEGDLDEDQDLARINEDTSVPEQTPVDTDTLEPMDTGNVTALAAVQCTKQRFLHVGNFSFVADFGCVNGVCPNGCWGVQRRTTGFSCDYDGSQGDRVQTRDGSAPFATYNEIKSLHPYDQTAVQNCRTQSGGRKLRTYAVWNGSGWDNEGISANVRFAELYGPQTESHPDFWTWYDGARANNWSPMENFSPETGIDFDGVKRQTARMCSATRTAWLGIYFYDQHNSGGSGMAAWKREAIIRGMNYCTTH